MAIGDLTDKQIKFVESFMENGSNSLAYKAAYSTSNMSDAAMHSNAYKIAHLPRVRTEISIRRAALAEKVTIDQAKLVEMYFKIVDDYNTGIYLSKSKKKEDQQAAFRMAQFVNSASAVASLKEVANMLGLSAPSATAINQGVIINIINPKN